MARSEKPGSECNFPPGLSQAGTRRTSAPFGQAVGNCTLTPVFFSCWPGTRRPDRVASPERRRWPLSPLGEGWGEGRERQATMSVIRPSVAAAQEAQLAHRQTSKDVGPVLSKAGVFFPLPEGKTVVRVQFHAATRGIAGWLPATGHRAVWRE